MATIETKRKSKRALSRRLRLMLALRKIEAHEAAGLTAHL